MAVYPNTVFSISLTSPSSMDSRDDGAVNLRVNDAASGEILMDVEMTPGRFWRLIQGSQQNHRGFMTTHPERIGQYIHTESLNVPPSITTGIYDRADEERLVAEWLNANRPTHWQTSSIRSTNRGFIVVGHWWNDVPDKVRHELADSTDDV